MRAFLIIVSALALSACSSVFAPLLRPDVTAEPVEVEGGEFALDPAHASVIFKIDHLGFSRYVGRFEVLDASLDFDAENPVSSRLEAVVDMSSLDIANDEFAAELMGPSWFDAEAFPQAIFRSTSIVLTGANTGQITGDLTLKGTTAPMVLDVTFNGGADDRLRGAYVVGFSATGEIDRTVFGVDRFAGLITDMVTLEIEAEFLRQ